MNPEIDPIFSKNISVIKVLAIIGIVFGHFWALNQVPIPLMEYWWVTSAIGLLVFSLTSGLFTAVKYTAGFDIKSYWIKKFWRIGIPFTVINCLLLILFLFQQREGLCSTQTAASWLGIHGFWTWFKIPQVGPYGAGLWFMTALILFYISYPLLEYINRMQSISNIFTIVIVILLLILDRTVPYGHTLWLTLSGFFLGVWVAKSRMAYSRYFMFGLILISLLLMLLFRFVFNIKALSGLFMLIISFTLVEVCNFIKFPPFIYKLFLPFSTWVLSIYIIHMYMFINPTGVFLVDWVLSFSIILCVSFFIDFSTKKIFQAIK